METLQKINFIIAAVFFICYSYQFLYIPIAILKKSPPNKPAFRHRFGVLICARNEEAVIGRLIESIRAQSYGMRDIRIFVMADNCNDETAKIARSSGAIVYKRNDAGKIGKGYALEALLRHISEDFPNNFFDGFFVFDADNVLDKNYIEEMNRSFCNGFEIITGYRNSKNYGDNWISAGYSLWFLRETQYLNRARFLLGSSCAVSGTGFFFSRRILEECGGWPFHLLTEDIEFTVHNIIRGEKIGFCEKALLYDEQPVLFRQSLRQRLRWAKGYLQIFGKYGGKLACGIFRGDFSCFDMTMAIMPAVVLSIFCAAINILAAALGFLSGGEVLPVFLSLCENIAGAWFTLFAVGAITTATEWKKIHTSAAKKILYAFTFPLFMFTYIPVSFAAIFAKAEWKPIFHNVSAGAEDFEK